jgi:hypothetical protein
MRNDEQPVLLPLPHASVSGSVSPSESKPKWRIRFELELDPDPELDHLDTTPFWKGFGAAMSSSPWEWLWNGDEDVATPSHKGAGARSAHGRIS